MDTLPDVPGLEDWLPIQEAAREYKVSTDSLYRLLAAGRLAKYRRELDKRTWVKRSELDVIFRPKRVEGPPD